MRVDFPAPFSPTSATTSPCAAEKQTESRAVMPGNRLVIPANSIMTTRSASARKSDYFKDLRDRSLKLLNAKGIHEGQQYSTPVEVYRVDRPSGSPYGRPLIYGSSRLHLYFRHIPYLLGGVSK